MEVICVSIVSFKINYVVLCSFSQEKVCIYSMLHYTILDFFIYYPLRVCVCIPNVHMCICVSSSLPRPITTIDAKPHYRKKLAGKKVY